MKDSLVEILMNRVESVFDFDFFGLLTINIVVQRHLTNELFY